MKYYIIAGEASGDLHGSNLIKEIKKKDEYADLRCWGGDLMQEAGSTIVKHYKDLAFMGFAEVIKNLPVIVRNIKFCKQDIAEFKPDVLVLIDYPGFNLRIAQWAKAQQYKVVYYISPQVWAWKESRVKLIKKVVDKMLVILPFEEPFFKKWEYKVQYVGHPLVQVIDEFLKTNLGKYTYAQPVIALLPGSRVQEVSKKLPLMLQASLAFPDYQFVLAQASALEDSFYAPFLKEFPKVASVKNDTYSLLAQATAALITSGTATLETALFGVPQVVCYKGSAVSYHIAKRLVKVKYISLVNLIMDKPVVTELIQNDLTVENITKELETILYHQPKKEQVAKDYSALKALLSQGGNASAEAAAAIVATAATNALPLT